MTTLQNRPNTALLVIDVQTGVRGEAYERDTTVANVGSVVERARGGGSGGLGATLERQPRAGQRSGRSSRS